MCGRYSLTAEADELLESFAVSAPSFHHAPRYNVAPTQLAPVVAVRAEGRRIGALRWGLVPFWAEDPSVGNRLINARSESVAEKPAFREAFRRRRCLVPADGFYEWARGQAGRTPYWVHRPDRRPIAFAGLWERWRPPGGEPLHTFTILTRPATAELRGIHPRMPVILASGAEDLWLDREASERDLLDVLRQDAADGLEWWPVSTRVNSPANDDPGLIRPVTVDPTLPGLA